MASDRTDPSEKFPEADPLDRHPTLDPPRTVTTGLLVEVAVRVHDDFAGRATLAEVLAVVTRCRDDLDTLSPAALPEMVERLTRQRLADQLALPATARGEPDAT